MMTGAGGGGDRGGADGACVAGGRDVPRRCDRDRALWGDGERRQVTKGGGGAADDAANAEGSDRRLALRVVVTGADKPSRDSLVSVLRADGIDAIAVGEDRRARNAVRDHRPDIVVMDRSPVSNALGLAQLLVARFEMDQRLILVSELDDPRDIRSAIKAGVGEYLIKPVNPQQLILAVRTAAGGTSTRRNTRAGGNQSATT